MKKIALVCFFCSLLLSFTNIKAQTEWVDGTIDARFNFWEDMTGGTFHTFNELFIEVHDSVLVYQKLGEKGCLMITGYGGIESEPELFMGCLGVNSKTGRLERVGGIPYNNFPTNFNSHKGEFYSQFVESEIAQIGSFQPPGACILLYDKNFALLDSISLEQDQAFWDHRYPPSKLWAPSAFDNHAHGAEMLNNEIYTFAIMIYRDSIDTNPEGTPVMMAIQRQNIVAYRFDSQVGRSFIVDILELDKNWDPDVLWPGNDPHHTNEISVTPVNNELIVAFSNRGVNNIYKVPFNENGFGKIDYILGGTFATDGTVSLPFVGNSLDGIPLYQQHGSEFISDPDDPNVDYLYSYNNGSINPGSIQQLSHYAVKVTNNVLVEDVKSTFVNANSSGAPIYSSCCGGIEMVFRADPFPPLLVMERGLSGTLTGTSFNQMIGDNMFEPIFSIKVPPPFSGSSEWHDVLDIYGPNNMLIRETRNGIMTILYENLPNSRHKPMKYWVEDGLTYVTHDEVFMWELDGNKIAKNENTVSIGGVLTQNDLEDRLKGFIRDSMLMWPIIGGFEERVVSGNKPNDEMISIVIFPNPAEEKLHVSSSQLDIFYFIYSVIGTKMNEGSIKSGQSKEIDILHLPAGMYILRVNDEQTRNIKDFPFVKK